MNPKLQIENLVKRYDGVDAARGVSFSVSEGEIFGLLGPNGAGKTTTIECTVGLRLPDGGRISVCGVDPSKDPDSAKSRIGVALQATALQDKITPREALRLFGSFYPDSAPPQQLIDRFGLAEKSDSPFISLSHGQRQRLALALAFVNRPELVFLDEPTTGLDPQSRRELHELIRRLRADGRTVILSTHYIEEAQSLCDRVAIIDHGRVIAEGKPAELIARSKALPRIEITTSRPGPPMVIRTSNVSQAIIDTVGQLRSEGVEVVDLHIHQPSLEDVFIELTGTALRE